MSKAAKKLFIKTYGCQMNVYDSQKMAEILAPLGYETCPTPEDADIAILNTCHIREKAEQKVFSDLGRLRPFKEEKKQQGKQMVIAVGGCVGQAEGSEIIKQAPYVDMVFGPQSYHMLPEMIARATRSADSQKKGAGRGIVMTDFHAQDKFDSFPELKNTQSAAFLAVQEGCDKFCTFCVVPYTRGAEFSRPVQTILDEAKKLTELGAKELTLLGQNVNGYHGEDAHGKSWSLADLIDRLSQLEGLQRIRYTTSHPRDMTQDLIDIHGSCDKLMPYLHLPVQSGSNNILKAMNRKHDRAFYFDIIERLKKARPDLALSSDFIVGFPGETDQDFEDTLSLVRQVGYAQAYSFKYSQRPGTPGASMINQVPEEVKSERLSALQDLLNEQQLSFNHSCVGKTFDILLEKKGKHDGQLGGRSPYMQSLFVEAQDRLLGQIVPVKITGAHPNGISGVIQTTTSTT